LKTYRVYVLLDVSSRVYILVCILKVLVGCVTDRSGGYNAFKTT